MLRTTTLSALLVLAATLTWAMPARAQAPAADTATAAELADGEIRKVDKDNKKLTIKHGPLTNLDMPGMTMVFGVQDERVLDQLQVGQQIRFRAEKIDGKFVVTRISQGALR